MVVASTLQVGTGLRNRTSPQPVSSQGATSLTTRSLQPRDTETLSSRDCYLYTTFPSDSSSHGRQGFGSDTCTAFPTPTHAPFSPFSQCDSEAHGPGILAHDYVHYFEFHTAKTYAGIAFSRLDMRSIAQVFFSGADSAAVRSAQTTQTEGEAWAAEPR